MQNKAWYWWAIPLSLGSVVCALALFANQPTGYSTTGYVSFGKIEVEAGTDGMPITPK